MTLRYGSLFSGYGGLDMAVQSVLGGSTAWFVEFDKHPSAILAHHWPDVPNYGDITKVDFTKVEPVDVLTGGYPCQPFSHAGQRQGVNDDRHLWPYVADGMAVLRPRLAVFENVRGHLSLGYDEVLRDLQQLGYEVRWITLRAADVGAAHGRARLFIFAEDTRNERPLRGRTDRRRGLDRHSADHLVLSGAPQDQHDRQGTAGAEGDGGGLWGSDRGGATGLKTRAATHLGMGPEWRGGWGDVSEAQTPLSREGCRCGRSSGVSRDAHRRANATKSGTILDGRDARPGRDAHAAHSGSEPTRSRPRAAEPAEREADSGLPLGLVVGTGGRPVRPGEVPGQDSHFGPNGGGTCVCAGQPLHELTLLPTPAVNDMGEGKTVDHWDAWTATMQAKHGNGNGHGKSLAIEAQRLLPTPVSDNSRGLPQPGTDFQSLPNVALSLLPTPTSSDSKASGAHGYGGNEFCTLTDATVRQPDRWGDYGPAITRWESAIGRTAPEPTEVDDKGKRRLSPVFVEWMQGLPLGHVTDPDIWVGMRPSAARSAQLKALGNGVVPQQAAAACHWWLTQTARGAVAS